VSKHAHTPPSAAVGIEHAIRMLESRWKLVILFHLFGGKTLRFSDLERAIRVSQKMLTQQRPSRCGPGRHEPTQVGHRSRWIRRRPVMPALPGWVGDSGIISEPDQAGVLWGQPLFVIGSNGFGGGNRWCPSRVPKKSA
jgi:HxlR-like helix-turn-helix